MPFRIDAKYAELENMYVEPRFRNNGLGARLVRDFKDWCKKNKVDYLAVTAAAQNNKAIKFYKKQGFGAHDETLEIILNKKQRSNDKS